MTLFELRESIKQLWYNITNPVYSLYRQLRRMLYWGWTMRSNYDWDFAYLEEMMLLKLKRMRKEMIKNCHCAWCTEPFTEEKETMQSLNLTIKLLERLTTRSDITYAIHSHNKMDEKWGDIVMNKVGKYYTVTRTKVLTEEDKELEKEDSLKLMDLNSNIYKRDRKWLYGIIAKYGPAWWD